jgi:hypothetical protein
MGDLFKKVAVVLNEFGKLEAEGTGLRDAGSTTSAAVVAVAGQDCRSSFQRARVSNS